MDKSKYIVFLNWVNGKKILNQFEYPQFFYYDYGITNCNQFHLELIEEGYLKESSLKSYLITRKIDELKKILENNNLKKTGKKEELIERILNEIEPSKIELDDKYYELTDKGIKIIKDNEYILKLRKLHIPIEEYEKVVNKIGENNSFNTIVWKLYNEKLEEEFKNKNFGMYRNIILEMASFLHTQNNYEKELDYLLRGLYCDLSGIGNKGIVEEKRDLFIPEVSSIYDLGEYFKEEMLEECFKIKLPFHYCNNKLFEKIVYDILEGSTEEEILRKYKSRMNKTPKDLYIL